MNDKQDQDDALREKLERIRRHGNWREAMRKILIANGVHEQEIEKRIAALTTKPRTTGATPCHSTTTEASPPTNA